MYGILPRRQIEAVDRLLQALLSDARRYEGVELLDQGQCNQLHTLAAELYAAGYSDGVIAQQVRESGMRGRQHERDRAEPQGGR